MLTDQCKSSIRVLLYDMLSVAGLTSPDHVIEYDSNDLISIKSCEFVIKILIDPNSFTIYEFNEPNYYNYYYTCSIDPETVAFIDSTGEDYTTFSLEKGIVELVKYLKNKYKDKKK